MPAETLVAIGIAVAKKKLVEFAGTFGYQQISKHIHHENLRETFQIVWDRNLDHIRGNEQQQLFMSGLLASPEFAYVIESIAAGAPNVRPAAREQIWFEINAVVSGQSFASDDVVAGDDNLTKVLVSRVKTEILEHREAFFSWYDRFIEEFRRDFFETHHRRHGGKDSALMASWVLTEVSTVREAVTRLSNLMGAVAAFLFVYVMVHAGVDVAEEALHYSGLSAFENTVPAVGGALAAFARLMLPSRQAEKKPSSPRTGESGNVYSRPQVPTLPSGDG